MKPIGLPVGSKILTPSCFSLPMPQPHQRLPSTSQRKPSGVPPGSAVMKGAAVGELGAVVDHVVDADHARRHAGLDDVELRLVGREREPVRPIDVARRHRRAAGLVETIDVGRQLGRRDVALVVAEDAERRIGEPDRVVGLHHDVVRRVERLAVELVDQHRDGAVVLGAGDAAAVVLAGDQPALAVAGVAVGIVRRLADRRSLARSPRPSA